MEATTANGTTSEYTTPHRVQAWFLRLGRDRWRDKYRELKADWKRLQQRLHDVGKSREKWRSEAEELRRRFKERELQIAALQAQAAAFKKGRPARGS